ncbi:YeiH family protein [Gryllotalpicola daejeonensis]|uniref:YeiH family protein n=1 Tax=Gryllotalpicola daejeonensis TaxID=993087 RepID=A0ABP7ZK19_9MICO
MPFSRPTRRLPGILICIAIALVATALGHVEPVVGAPVFGIVIGSAVAAVVRPSEVVDSGAAWSGKYVLQGSVVVLGSGLSLGQVVHTGWQSLPVMLGTLVVALVGGVLIGRALGLAADVRTLVAVGTAICGASAIAATQSVIRAKADDVAYAIGTIFTFNVVAVLSFPFIGHALGFGDQAFGLWAGTAINDTSSVVAAAFTFSAAAGQYGVVVKLTRTLMIIPITIGIAVYRRRIAAKTAPAARGPEPPASPAWSWRSIVPQFLIWFVVVVAINSLGGIPSTWHPALSLLGTFMITVALAGIGLGTRVQILRSAGLRPLVLGAALWVLVALTSLGLQALSPSMSGIWR